MRYYKICLLVIFVFLLSSCVDKNNNTIMKDFKEDDVEVIYEEVRNNEKIILYESIVVTDVGYSYNALNVAYFRFLDGKWAYKGDNDWASYQIDKDLNVYSDKIFYYHQQKRQEFNIIFGKIQNPKILKIKVIDGKSQDHFANIINRNGEKYFYKIGHYLKAVGLTDDENIFFEEYAE